MKIITKSSGRDLVVCICGELDHYKAEKIRAELDEAITRAGLKRLIFDFSELTFMDSTGIGLLIGRYKRAKERGIDTAIYNPREGVSKILKLSGIYSVISVINS